MNCIRTLPHMRELYKRFSGDRFVLVGVHTPEFAFEKDPENVASAVKRFGIEYPVAIDSENETWKLYGNQYWPRQTLIDATGRVRWEHAGEGDYDKMGEQIMLLLKEAGENVTNTATAEKTKGSWKERLGLESKRITPEIYVGSLRSRGFGNGHTNTPGTHTKFVDSGEHQQDIPYLDGEWIQNPEFVAHVTSDPGYIALKYTAKNANAVLGSSTGKPVRVNVELDGRAMDKSQAGADVQWERDSSYIMVSDNRLYDIVRTKNNETHELKLVTESNGLCLYTYTFG